MSVRLFFPGLYICAALAFAFLAASPIYGQDLLLNGSFEEKDANGDPVGSHWVMYNGAQVWAKLPNQVPVTVYDGSYSLAAKSLSGVSTVGAWQVLATAPGTQWSVSGWALNSENNKLGLGCYGLAQIEFLGADDSVKSTVQSAAFAQVMGGWNAFSLTGTAPADAVSARVGVMLHQTSNPSGVLFLDGLQAYAATPVPEPGRMGGVMAAGVAALAAGAWRRKLNPKS